MSDLEQLIVDVNESLEREFASVKEEMREGFASLNTRFDTQSTRLERHAALWQTGARWSAKMDVWAEKVDTALEAKDREIAELRARLDRLERKSI